MSSLNRIAYWKSNANDIRFASGNVNGNAALTLIPNGAGEDVAISTGTPGDLNFNPNVFSSFDGHLILGGTLSPTSLPFAATAANVIADKCHYRRCPEYAVSIRINIIRW